MRYFKDQNNKPFVFEDNVTQDIISKVEATHGTTLTEITLAEYEALIAPSSDEILAQQAQAINNAIQNHLDTKAQEFRYDNMMSARSYAGYTNPFQTEAQSLAVWASDCWVVAGQIEADVQAGTRPMPTVDEVIAELPVYV